MNIIRQLREENKMTQDDLATCMKVTRTSVTKWETGKANPSTHRLIALSKIFNCSIDTLLCNKR